MQGENVSRETFSPSVRGEISLRRAHEKEDYERMIAGSDRLREEIQAANATLDQMLAPSPPS
jgi:hypothetical protein